MTTKIETDIETPPKTLSILLKVVIQNFAKIGSNIYELEHVHFQSACAVIMTICFTSVDEILYLPASRY